MSIQFHKAEQIFHLQSKDTSYVFQLVKGFPAHVYWGRAIRGDQLARIIQYRERASFSPNPFLSERMISLDTIPLEYPAYGSGDFRHPAYQIQQSNGTTISEALYRQHRIFSGKPKLEGLPATYVEQDTEADTLELELFDPIARLTIVLTYTIFNELDAITRSVRFINEGSENLNILRVLSMSIDFNHSEYDFLHLSGAWTRERHIERRALAPGMQAIESRRGSSSHQQNPFVALLSKGSNEDYGDVFGFSLVYSGSFVAQTEVDQFRTTRVSMGINPFDFN